MSKKFILILLDGLGDRSFPQLGCRTPLQAAHTPFLDYLAGQGCSGLYHASCPGQALPSENAHFAMFGYDLREFPGRGALEALGAGIELERDEVSVLTHFVNVSQENGRLRLMQDKVQADPDEAGKAFSEVAEFEANGLSIRLVPVKGLFGVIILKGGASAYITDSNPVLDGNLLSAIQPLKSHVNDPASANTARVLKKYLCLAYDKLSRAGLNAARQKAGKPTLNALVTQRPGRLRDPVPFAGKNGLKGLTISSGVVYQGLGAYLGMDVRHASEFDDPGREIKDRVNMAKACLEDYDFIHVHSKAPDEAAHQKDPLLKKKVIQSLDQGLSEALPALLEREDVVVAVTADHSTPSGGPLVHSGEPVPLLIAGPGVRVDQVDKFDEISAACGGLGCVRGKEFMYLVLNYLERSKLVGLMDTPVDQPYWPGNPEPFTLE